MRRRGKPIRYAALLGDQIVKQAFLGTWMSPAR
jgi:hypothetical protein